MQMTILLVTSNFLSLFFFLKLNKKINLYIEKQELLLTELKSASDIRREYDAACNVIDVVNAVGADPIPNTSFIDILLCTLWFVALSYSIYCILNPRSPQVLSEGFNGPSIGLSKGPFMGPLNVPSSESSIGSPIGSSTGSSIGSPIGSSNSNDIALVNVENLIETESFSSAVATELPLPLSLAKPKINITIDPRPGMGRHVSDADVDYLINAYVMDSPTYVDYTDPIFSNSILIGLLFG